MTKPLTKAQQVLKTFPTPGTNATDKMPPNKAKRATPFVKRVRAVNEALPKTSADWRDSDYEPTRRSPLRPGSQDALAYPSRTNDSYFYPLTGLRTEERA